MRKIFIFMLLCVLLTACNPMSKTYQYENLDETIEYVELLHNLDPTKEYSEKNFQLIRKLAKQEIVPFMKKLYSLPTCLGITPPSRAYGKYVVRVFYQNGDMEIFSDRYIELVKAGESSKNISAYYFSGDVFNDFFLEHVDQIP